MVTLEQVEKLRERTGVSYEEAKKVLEEANGDLLEAVILLEKRQQIGTPAGGGYYHTGQTGNHHHQQHQQTGAHGEKESFRREEAKDSGSTFGEMVGNFFRWCGKVIHKGNSNGFRVLKDNEKIMVIPLTAMVLLLIFAFWIIIPLLIIGLFFGYRYRFEGPDLGKPSVNKAMDSVANAADNFKNDVAGNKQHSNQAESHQTDKGENQHGTSGETDRNSHY